MRNFQISVGLGVIVTVLVTAPGSWAGVIATRGEVATLLGPGALTEDFSKFNPSPGAAYALDHPILDSTVTEHGRGPGLVNPGLRFSSTGTNSNLQWSGVGAITNPSAELTFIQLQNVTPGKVDFTSTTPAFGVDLVGIRSSNTPANATFTLRVYAPDDTTLLDTRVVALNANTPVFFGYAAPGGIGSFTLQKDANSAQSISIDDLLYNFNAAVVVDPRQGGFANPVPLPPALWTGLAAAALCLTQSRRRPSK